MDEPGFRARRRADHEERLAAKQGRLGHGIANTAPMPEEDYPELTKIQVPPTEGLSGYSEPNYRPPPNVPDDQIPGASKPGDGLQGTNSAPGSAVPLPPAPGRRRMQPHLQVMLGPILRYDTVVNNVWHGFAMIVTSDDGSSYAPAPTLTVEWDPLSDDLAAAVEKQMVLDDHLKTDEGVHKRVIPGTQIYQYASLSGGQSFWRFKIEIPLGEKEEEVHYSVNGGAESSFWVPAFDQNLRWVSHSCNGFSAGVDTASFNGPDPLWRDVLRAHESKPFHVVIGGGDQIYCDPLTKEPEMAAWMTEEDSKVKEMAIMTDEMKLALDRFLFNHYCMWFRAGAFGTTIKKIPMLNICDDHDIIDGFGSYPDALQSSPVFSAIGSRGYFWYLLFQMFVVDDIDGTSKVPGTHPSKSAVFGGEGAWIPFPNRSWLSYLGPKVYILLLDCRAERKKDQICSPETYDKVFAALRALPSSVEHLVMLLGVPIVYPRMNALENMLESKYNPLTMIAKTGSLGLGGFVNKFNKEAELLDDMNDHWCAGHHKKERNWLIEQLQKLAVSNKLRISYLSGDVHAACVAKLYTKGGKVDPLMDPKYQLQIVSSAIVNTPPPPPVIILVSTLGKKKHKTLHYVDTDEEMVNMFQKDTDESVNKHNTTVMGRRNYAIVDYLPGTGELNFDIRVEKTQGSGTTKSYPIAAPPPKW